MRNLTKVLFIISIVITSISYAYEAEKGKIDTHGGKGDSITSNGAFGMAIGLGSVLNKKGSSEEIKENKKFIPLEEENIQNIEQIKEN